MPASCSACNCSVLNRFGKLREDGSKLQFHRFPLKKPDLLIKWVHAVRRESWQPTKASVLCGEHFPDDCYISSARRYLKEDAVPSKFSFPSYFQPKEKKRRIVIKHPLPEPKRLQEDKLQVPIEIPEVTANTSLENSQNIMDKPNTASANSQQQNSVSDTQKKALRRKIKLLQQTLRRRDKKISDLQSLLSVAQKSYGMSTDTANMLKETYGELPFELLVHQIKNKTAHPNGKRYSSSMKEFALTLYFYSPRAYNFLRKKVCLPHPAMLRSWVSSVKCYPGFMEEAFDYLEKMSNDKSMDCSLIFDSMSIRKQVIWDEGRKKYSGYIDCVGMMDGKESCLASEALVFLVVSLTQKFKCPVAYFFIDKINATVLSELVKVCLEKLNKINVNILSITADGNSSNVQAFQLLGCKFSGGVTVNEFKTNFPHPISGSPVHIIFDPAHMLKLARHMLAEKKSLKSESGCIYWHYIQSLNTVQESMGFKFANKVSGAHVNYANKKMNVSLAAQTLSSGTADAIEFLMKTKNPSFCGAEATIEILIKYLIF